MNARPDGALLAVHELAARHDLVADFPDEVEREVAELLAHPGTDDRALTDLTSLPFVTVDGPGTRDLDQALFIARDNDGFRVDYALADAAYYVRPASALFQEALRRGASFYLPGFSIPMLPRKLSEGMISLNAGVVRRALVFRMHLDAAGRVRRTDVVRARVRSRAQLTFDDVDRFLSDGAQAIEMGESLRLMRRVGELRLLDAERRDVPRYLRHETELAVDATGEHFVVASGRDSPVESYNEQLSLLCNSEGARLLLAGDRPDDGVQPIYRVHPRPDAERMRELAALLEAVASHHGLSAPRWHWRRAERQSLAQFLAGLPTEGAEGRIASAMHRQAVLSNLRSTYSEEPGRHHGIGAEVYARFSAPMREIVGVFVHKELAEKLSLSGARSDKRDEALRARVVERAGEARQLQKRLTKEAMRIALDRLFEADEALPSAERPRRKGTVMGLDRVKLHVLLDEPRFEVKAYVQHLERELGGRLELSKDGVALLRDDQILYRVGDAVTVQVAERDRRGDRWVLSLDGDTR